MPSFLFRLLTAVFLLSPLSVQAAQILIVGHSAPPSGGPHRIGTQVFAEELQRRLPGRFEVDEKGGVTLGADPELWEAVRLGSVDIALITNIALSPQVPEMGVFSVPFLFRDSAHAAKVLNGPVGQFFTEKLNKSRVVVLAWGEIGFRHMTSSLRPIVKPDDLVGQRIRIVPNPIYRQTFLTLGAEPVEMWLPELYNALKKGMVDGEDNPLLVFQANHLDEVQKYVSLTGHFYNPLLFMMNANRFKSLSKKEQRAIQAAAEAGAAATRKAIAAHETQAIQAFRKKGLVVIDKIDRAEFVKKLEPLQPEFDKAFGTDLLRKIRETR